MDYLILVACLGGLLTLIYDTAYGAYLPTLVDRKSVTEANSALEMSSLLAGLAGPGISGWLIQLISAPVSIAVDAFSFLASAFAVWTIRAPEAPPEVAATSAGFWRELAEGLHVLWRDATLRAIAACAATENFFGGITDVVRVLFFVQVLHLGAIYFGLMFSVASLSALAGAAVNPRLARALGIGPTMLLSASTLATGWLLIPLASGPPLVKVSLIAAGALLFGVSNTLLNVNEASLRQQMTPNHLLGRVGAGMRFIGDGSLPLGALVGGILGEHIGLRATFLVGSSGLFLAVLWLYYSPVRSLRVPPGDEPSLSGQDDCWRKPQ
jgi:MFS family permease